MYIHKIQDRTESADGIKPIRILDTMELDADSVPVCPLFFFPEPFLCAPGHIIDDACNSLTSAVNVEIDPRWGGP